MISAEYRVGSAVTVLNAIRAEKGAALGTHLQTVVRVSNSSHTQFNTTCADNTLLEECLRLFNTEICDVGHVRISVQTSLPPARGLKTSSSVSLATIGALSLLKDIELSEDELVSLSARASLNVGVSITGAIDDAYACLKGGLVVTDTINRTLVHHSVIDTHNVILLVPKTTNEKKNIDSSLNSLDQNLLVDAMNALEAGDFHRCIQLNTEVYASNLGDLNLIHKLKQFAENVGLNGAGPSIFLLNPTVSVNFIRTQAPLYDIFLTSTR